MAAGAAARSASASAASAAASYPGPVFPEETPTEGSATSVSVSRGVARAFENVEQGEGVGARVRRSIGHPRLKFLDPFLMLDVFTVAAPAGFPDHPHRGFETVTYMLDGVMTHEDFAGHKGSIGPGDLQWMTAGRGIVHSEVPEGKAAARGLQLWVNLAAKDKMVEPAYQELLRKDVPKVAKDGVSVAVVAGEALGVKSPVRTRTPTMYLDIALEAGKELQQPIPAGWNAFAYVFDGPVSFGGGGEEAGTVVKAQHTVLFTNSTDADGLTIRAAADAPARLVLIAGQPIGEPVVQHGPFVMNTREEIMRTMHDYSTGTNGFERAASWASEAVRKRGY